MKDHSHLDKKTLFMHRTFIHDEGKWDEYFFLPLEASKGVVTALQEVMPTVFCSLVFDDWFIELFEKNTDQKEFKIGSRKVVPDYTVRDTVDLRIKKA